MYFIMPCAVCGMKTEVENQTNLVKGDEPTGMHLFQYDWAEPGCPVLLAMVYIPRPSMANS